jgi:hypothetical protein
MSENQVNVEFVHNPSNSLVGIEISHDMSETHCFICDKNVKRYTSHCKTKSHINKRLEFTNKVLVKYIGKVEKEREEIKKQNCIIKLYHTPENCSVCLDESKQTYSGFFHCSHSICEDCESNIVVNKCPLCRSDSKTKPK